MVLGCYHADRLWCRSCCFQLRRDARCIYLICLAASVLSVLVLAYVTSYRLEHGPYDSRLVLGGKLLHHGNGSAGKRIHIVGFVNKNGKKYRIESLLDYPEKPIRNLSLGHNGSRVGVTAPAMTSSTPAYGLIRTNCTGIDRTSEILDMEQINFLKNFKNPCWYEPLRTSDVYKHNKFILFSRYARRTLKDLTQEWSKRIYSEPFPQRLRCLPYFFIAGQPKCGSTDLYRKLTSHPDVLTPPIKESHWWGKNRYGWRLNYTTSIPLQDYVDLYDKAALFIEHVEDPSVDEENEAFHHLITGDASVSTLWDNDEWWRLGENCGETEPVFTNAHYVHHILPQSKIIIILRDPVERLYSDYLYFQKVNKSAEEFDREVRMSIAAHERCRRSNTLRTCVYNRTVASRSRVRLRIGIYSIYVEEWLKVFPRNQVLITRLEDYATDTKSVLHRVFEFLGLRRLDEDEVEHVFNQPVANSRRLKDKKLGFMLEETRKRLHYFYEPFNQKLARLLRDNRYLWRNSHVSKSTRSVTGSV